MENLSLKNKAILYAIEKGYKVKNDVIISPHGKILKLQKENGYLSFNVTPTWNGKKRCYHIKVHRFVAYQKYGNKIFEPDIVVRHLNGNPIDNSEKNIDIGTQSDNLYDRIEEDRIKTAINASKSLRKFTDETIIQIKLDRANGMSYNDLMKKYNISSKGTMSYIINNTYKTTV